MDPEPTFKIINYLKKRGFLKEANILEDLFSKKPKIQLITDCPICGSTPEPDCVLCDGTGELTSAVPDDDEDKRIEEALTIEKNKF